MTTGPPPDPKALSSVLICHQGDELNRQLIARWLASFSRLAGILVLDEQGKMFFRRLRREYERIGAMRMLDVLAMRVYYNLGLKARDKARLRARLDELYSNLPELDDSTEILITDGPNNPEAQDFLTRLAPDFMLARCKRILAERIFTIPRHGTYVMHPGVCPEYRNAHGCFWALANDDLENVGLTLLKVDKGVDTGPVLGYYSYPYDEVNESHIAIMQRVALENLDPIRDKLVEAFSGVAEPLDTSGRPSGVWGQPWLTKYMRWKRMARRRSARARHRA